MFHKLNAWGKKASKKLSNDAHKSFKHNLYSLYIQWLYLEIFGSHDFIY